MFTILLLFNYFVYICTRNPKGTQDILLNGLSITTREKKSNTTELGLPHYGRRLPISVVVCGEPRDLWRMPTLLNYNGKTHNRYEKKFCL